MHAHRPWILVALLGWGALSLTSGAGSALAQDPPCVDFAEHPHVRHLVDVWGHAAAARSPIAYLVHDDELTAVLYEHTTAPRVLDRIEVAEWGGSRDRELAFVADDPDLLLLIDPGGLQAVDVSDPRRLQLRSALEWWPASAEGISREVRDAAVAGDRAYLIVSSYDAERRLRTDVLRVLDLAAPEPGEILAELDLTPRAPRELRIAGHHAYLRGEGLTVVDVADPSAPVEVGHQGLVPGWSSFAVADGHLYAAVHDSTVAVYDLADPAVPRRIGTTPVERDRGGMIRAPGGDLLVLWEPESVGLQLVDVRQPDTPVLRARIGDVGDDIFQPVLAGDQVLIPCLQTGLFAADVSRPARQPRLGDRGLLPGRTGYLLHGDHLLVRPASQLLAYDLRDDDAPGPLVVDEDCTLAFPALRGDLLALGGDGELRLLDIADISAPDLLATIPWPDDVPGRLAFFGDVLRIDFVHLSATYLVDTSDPLAPVMHGPLVFPQWETAVLGDLVVTVGDSLTVHDVSDPAQPQVLAAVDVPGVCGAPVVAHGHLYGARPDGTVLAFDLTDPAAPALVATLPSSFEVLCYCGHAQELRIVGDLLYLSSAGAGVRVMDIAEPGRPRHLGFLSGPANHMGTYAFAADARRVCMGDPDGHLVIAPAPCAEQSDPDAPVEPPPPDPPGEVPPLALVAVAPNPANPGARITFAVDRAGPVDVAIHDLAGRRLTTLVDRSLPRGRHVVTWDGRDGAGRVAASGIYLVRVRGGGHTDVRKLAVIR
jgi:hypothetical protein